MKINYLCLVLCLVFSGLFSEVQAAPREAATAAISKVDGDGVAKVRRKSGVESVAGEKQELFDGDKITTDARSVVEIMLADGTLVRVGLNSEYRLESVEKQNGIFSWVFGLAKGSIRAMVEKNPNKKMVKFRVNTPVGTMGVRGTELVLDHNEKAKRTTLYTIEGRVEFGRAGCYLKRKCIEVKAGEMASIGDDANEQPVAKPASAASVLLIGTPPGEKEASMEAAGDEARLARSALFTSVKAAEALKNSAGGIDAKDKGGVDKILQDASNAMADAQDKLLGRTKAERENFENAVKDGSYGDRLKLAEKFDDLLDGSDGKGKDRKQENLNAATVNKKLNLAEAVLKSKKMRLALEKRAAMDNSLITAKLKAAQQSLSEAKKKIAGPREPISTATSTSTSITTSSQTEIATAGGGQGGAGQEKDQATLVKEIIDDLTKKKVDGIISEPEVGSGYEKYKAYEKCSFLQRVLSGCGDERINGDWYEEITKKNATGIERRNGACYKTVQQCGKEMIPCDLSKGKACKPTFKEYACKKVSQAVACPSR